MKIFPERSPIIWMPQKGIPPVFPVIPETGYWTGNNNLGQKRQIQTSSNNRQSIAKMSEWGPPVVWTVSLDAAPTRYPNLVQAEIIFGVGGSTQTMTVDWIQGTQLSVVANAIEVVASYVSITPGSIEEIELGAQFSRGNRGGGLSPRVTIINRDSIANGATSDRVRIPPFVHRLKLLPVGGTPAGYADTDVAKVYDDKVLLLTVTDDIGAGNTAGAMRGSDFLKGIPGLDVTGGAHFVQVFNNSAASIQCSVYGEISA